MDNLSYIAGLFDGEGDVGIDFRRQGRADKSGKIRRYPRLRARISNTDRDVLEWVKRTLNRGSVQTTARNDGRKTCYTWVVQTAQARGFLKEIAPYLKIKQGSVLVALETDARLVRPHREIR